MKTIDLARRNNDTMVTVQLSEYELALLVALVEQGKRQLQDHPASAVLQGHVSALLRSKMKDTADEFCSLLGHLELLAANE
ncbi:MAG: hypothetical protein AAGF35_04100 [Pseudomonadota bacterium]